MTLKLGEVGYLYARNWASGDSCRAGDALNLASTLNQPKKCLKFFLHDKK